MKIASLTLKKSCFFRKQSWLWAQGDLYRAKHKTNSCSATNILTSYINPKQFSPLRDNENESSEEHEYDEKDCMVQSKRDQQQQKDDNDSENNENSTESIRYTNNVTNFKNLNKIKMASSSAPLVHSSENNIDVRIFLFISIQILKIKFLGTT